MPTKKPLPIRKPTPKTLPVNPAIRSKVLRTGNGAKPQPPIKPALIRRPIPSRKVPKFWERSTKAFPLTATEQLFAKRGIKLPPFLRNTPPAIVQKFIHAIVLPTNRPVKIPKGKMLWVIFKRNGTATTSHTGVTVLASEAEIAGIAKALLPQFAGKMILEPLI